MDMHHGAVFPVQVVHGEAVLRALPAGGRAVRVGDGGFEDGRALPLDGHRQLEAVKAGMVFGEVDRGCPVGVQVVAGPVIAVRVLHAVQHKLRRGCLALVDPDLDVGHGHIHRKNSVVDVKIFRIGLARAIAFP